MQSCHIHTRKDNRGDRVAYVLQSRALREEKGFVFKECHFTSEGERTSPIYIGRSSGTGGEHTPLRWDSIALIDCTIESSYTRALFTDEGGTRRVYPKGQEAYGWREYNTAVVDGKGETPIDKAYLYKDCYSLTTKEYSEGYKSALTIARGTPIGAAILNGDI